MDTTIKDIIQLTGVGLAGLTIWLTFRLVTNHLVHNTQVLNELIQVIRELKEWLQNHHDKINHK